MSGLHFDRSRIVALSFLALLAASCAPSVPLGELAPVTERSTNEMRDADLQVIAQWGARLDTLDARAASPAAVAPGGQAASAEPARTRALAAARAWLAFARDEYVRAPASPVVDAAFGQARRIITDAEAGRAIAADVPLVLGTARVRDDLWAELDRLQAYAELDPRQHGEASVLLVRAGRVPIPGDTTVCDPAPFLARAEGMVATMVAAVAPPAEVHLAAARPKPLPVVVRSVYFALNRDSLGPAGRKVLDVLVASLEGREGVTIELQGFADPRGGAAYNVELSRRRASAVQAYIAERTRAVVRFDLKPVGRARASAAGSDRVQLARDRRVDLRILLSDGTEAERAGEIDGDLQVERERAARVRGTARGSARKPAAAARGAATAPRRP